MRAPLIIGSALAVVLLGGAILPPTGTKPGMDTTENPAESQPGLVSKAHAVMPPRPNAEPVKPRPVVSTPDGAPEPQPYLFSSETPSDDTEDLLQRAITVSRGDTLMGLLVKADVPRAEAHAAISALRPVYDLRRMKIGQTFTLTLTPPAEKPQEAGAGTAKLLRMSFRPSVEQDIHVRHDAAKGYHAEIETRPLTRRDSYATGTITTSLYESALDASLPLDVLMRLILVFSFDVDFQREVQPGDGFAVLYNDYRDELGETVRTGEIAWASMTLRGKTLEYARFTPKGGFPEYYDRRGQSVKKTLMRTPINGARLSSRFGKRRHPILGFTKMHRGVDFAAPKGVPIMAAGDGVIESIGRNGGYGKYIRIRHNSTYKTAYAHMSSYKRGLKRGSRVRQGSTIGYVGSTGRSTGPHLHYEVLKNGRQMNPMSVRLPAGDKLKGKSLKTFLAGWPALDDRIAKAKGGQEFAEREAPKSE